MSDANYRVFGLDRQLYGPVPLATLREWARDGRVQRESWVHVEEGPREAWERAHNIAALAADFVPPVPAVAAGSAEGGRGPETSKLGISPKVLTRLKLFGDFPSPELEPFARAMVEEAYRPFSFIVQQGAQGDGMYFVIQGKVGVSTKGFSTETFLVALGVGDTFGEMSLFDDAPRSANVRADSDVIVLKLTAEALDQIGREAPVAANRFLRNVARLLSARVRFMDKRAMFAQDVDASSRVAK